MPLPKFEHHDARHKPTLIEPARSQMTASSPRGTFSQAELTAEWVITRRITRNAESSAGLKVPHVELTVLSVIRGRNPGGFTQECVADNGPSASTTLVR